MTYCERNYNLVELGPKGTGKSHVFSEFSPHGMLISGGEIDTERAAATVLDEFRSAVLGKLTIDGAEDHPDVRI